jgi:hypothetical protein
MIHPNVVINYLVISGLFSLVGVPLALGKVPPNPWYGFRTAAMQANPRLWYPVNVRIGLDLIVSGLSLAVVAWAVPRFWPTLPPNVYMGVWTGGAVLALLVVLVRGGLLLQRLAGEQPSDGGRDTDDGDAVDE